MKSRAKFIPIIVALGLLMSLIAIIPAFAVQGTVRILDASLGDATIWTNQTATIHLEVKDADLNVPLKRVLFPDEVTGLVGDQSATAGGTTVTSSADISGALAVGDTVLLPGERVKKVDTIASDGLSFTVTTAFVNAQHTVAASEVDVLGGSFDNCPDCTDAPTVSVTTDTIEQVFALPNFPITDTNVGSALENRFSGAPDTAFNKLDARVVDDAGIDIANLVVNSLDAPNGVLKIQCTPACVATAGSVLYWTSTSDSEGAKEDPVNASRVFVKSQADAGGIGVIVTETGADTGVFERSLQMCATAGCTDKDSTPPKLQVGPGDVVTFTYKDASGSTTSVGVTVESDPASFTNLTPAHDDATTSSLPIVSGDVTDGASGVQETSIRVKFNVNASVTILDPNVGVTGSVSAITGGFAVQQRNPTVITDGDVIWWITADDEAGNAGVSDRVAASILTGTVDVDTSTAVVGVGTDFVDELVVGQTITVAGETKKVMVISSVTALTVSSGFSADLAPQQGSKSTCSPSLFTGIGTPTVADNGGCDPFVVKVDNTVPDMTSSTTGQWWDSTSTDTDKTEIDPTKALKTSVLVQFNEDIDGSTVQLSDFLVGGVLPVAVRHEEDNADAVFLTVSTLTPDAKPEVKLNLGAEIRDKAGNRLLTDTVTAGDGIAPSITVVVTGTGASVPITKNKVTIQFSSDEPATVTSTSVVVKIMATATTLGRSETVATPSPSGSQTWTVDVTPATNGLYNVYVTANDLSGNQGTKGEEFDPSDSSAILFEKDTSAQAPTFTPTTDTDDPNTFIIIKFSDEGKEYGLDAGGAFSIILANVVTSKDTHKTVTLTSATLDDVDILSSINTEDDIDFLFKASALALGDHEVKVKATDGAGNDLAEVTHTFEVKAKELFSVKLNPGWNMISLPNSPADPAINSVIGSGVPVTAVTTYDPSASGGPWLTAVKDTSTGNLVGSLTQITGGRAYWVQTSTFQPIKVDIPGISGGQQTTPPTVTLAVGWNMVPVIDVTGTKSSGDLLGVTSAQYLANIKFSRIYEYDTLTSQFNQIQSTDALKVALGYWVYVTEAATLVP